MMQYIVVFLLVGAAIIYVVRSGFKKLKSGKTSSGCSGCSGNCTLKCSK